MISSVPGFPECLRVLAYASRSTFGIETDSEPSQQELRRHASCRRTHILEDTARVRNSRRALVKKHASCMYIWGTTPPAQTTVSMVALTTYFESIRGSPPSYPLFGRVYDLTTHYSPSPKTIMSYVLSQRRVKADPCLSDSRGAILLFNSSAPRRGCGFGKPSACCCCDRCGHVVLSHLQDRKDRLVLDQKVLPQGREGEEGRGGQGRQTDRQTDRHTDTETDRQTDRQIRRGFKSKIT